MTLGTFTVSWHDVARPYFLFILGTYLPNDSGDSVKQSEDSMCFSDLPHM